MKLSGKMNSFVHFFIRRNLISLERSILIFLQIAKECAIFCAPTVNLSPPRFHMQKVAMIPKIILMFLIFIFQQ
jgi:hypothetical protein